MDFDRKTILAFILIGLVFIFTYSPMYQKMIDPEGYEQQQQQIPEPIADTESSEPAETVQNEDSQQPVEPNDIVSPDKPSDITLAPAQDPSLTVQETPNVFYTIDTEKQTLIFSSQGADLISASLKNYMDPRDEPVQLVPESAEGMLSIGFIDFNGDTLSTKDWSFQSDSRRDISLTGNETATLTFTVKPDESSRITKTFTFFGDRYDFNLTVDFFNMDRMISQRQFFLHAPDGLASTEDRLKDDMAYAKAVLSAGGEIEKGYKTNDKRVTETGDIDWLAVRTKYFSLAMIPQERKGISALIHGTEIPVSEIDGEWKKYDVSLAMPYLGERTSSNPFKIYVGPLDNDILKSYNANLEKMMDFGMKIIQPFSIAILWTFKFIHRFVPNYGVVLIIFAFLIKIIVYPLTHKSFESMKKMQELQPRMNEIKEKYANDPQRMNKETMKLYKETGVNPLGGCLPTLLQMPLLFGLFIVFRSTIELRNEGFALWINDLSSPDTIATLPFSIPLYGDSLNVLPIVMGATMILQQKLTVSDPRQKAFVYLMPIFMTLLFNQFPSGLNLYYALFNLLSIVQQKWLVHPKTKVAPSK
ncbi:membrane protein insertase YidC [candidate division KSB1 bacterium]|nr:membrane protein insertase YidC [candidate division KSB1 bacterium]